MISEIAAPYFYPGKPLKYHFEVAGSLSPTHWITDSGRYDHEGYNRSHGNEGRN
jgi:hypothetical protein